MSLFTPHAPEPWATYLRQAEERAAEYQALCEFHAGQIAALTAAKEQAERERDEYQRKGVGLCSVLGYLMLECRALDGPNDAEARRRIQALLDDPSITAASELALTARIAELERETERLRGGKQPDAHPEATCERCHRQNVWSWHAPSPLWNVVMRDQETGIDRFNIVCPSCFAELVELCNIGTRVDGHKPRLVWCFRPHDLDVTQLWADGEARVWGAEQCLWVAQPAEAEGENA